MATSRRAAALADLLTPASSMGPLALRAAATSWPRVEWVKRLRRERRYWDDEERWGAGEVDDDEDREGVWRGVGRGRVGCGEVVSVDEGDEVKG